MDHLTAPTQIAAETAFATYNGLYEKLDIFREKDSFAKRQNMTKNGMERRLWKHTFATRWSTWRRSIGNAIRSTVCSIGLREVQNLLAMVDIERLPLFGRQKLSPPDLFKLDVAPKRSSGSDDAWEQPGLSDRR